MVKFNEININKTNSSSFRGKRMGLPEELGKIITRISGRVEKEIPDTGFFRDFSENIGNLSLKDFFGKDIALFIQRDAKRDGYAYFGVAVQHPTMGIDAYSYLMSGKRKEILDFIAGEDGLNRIQSAAAQLSESLKNR